MTDDNQTLKSRLLDAALTHVVFDGWSDQTFAAAVTDTGIPMAMARGVCPRGALDLALEFHARGDRAMLDALADRELTDLRFRERIALAVRLRIEAIEDKEAVRRASALFALPQNAPAGARAVWNTCDLIWTTLGDTSRDGNWYSKRAILSGVYSATILYWLGDQSEGHSATWDFLDRRIENVMQFEKLKADMRKNPVTKPFMDLQSHLFSRLRAPGPVRGDVPGTQGGDAV